MLDKKNFYINGAWVKPNSSEEIKVIDPATEENCAVITLGNKADVDIAVNAAKDAYCLLYTSPSPRDRTRSRMPSSA